MNHDNIIWTSEPIHTDVGVCVDVKATSDRRVILGQVHGEHDSYASDLRMAPEYALAIGHALIDAAEMTGGRS